MNGQRYFTPLGSWTTRAACRGLPDDLMYPDHWTPRKTRAARRVCRSCPVERDCLLYAMTVEPAEYRFGMWGGKTPAERSEIGAGLPVGRQLEPIDHGTPEGARAHYRRGEKPCPPCAAANRLAAAESREKARAS